MTTGYTTDARERAHARRDATLAAIDAALADYDQSVCKVANDDEGNDK